MRTRIFGLARLLLAVLIPACAPPVAVLDSPSNPEPVQTVVFSDPPDGYWFVFTDGGIPGDLTAAFTIAGSTVVWFSFDGVNSIPILEGEALLEDGIFTMGAVIDNGISKALIIVSGFMTDETHLASGSSFTMRMIETGERTEFEVRGSRSLAL